MLEVQFAIIRFDEVADYTAEGVDDGIQSEISTNPETACEAPWQKWHLAVSFPERCLRLKAVPGGPGRDRDTDLSMKSMRVSADALLRRFLRKWQ
ncbi:MAG: hypothetical protein ACLUVM_06775 [Blautia faecis]